jgi:hypothetical protein
MRIAASSITSIGSDTFSSSPAERDTWPTKG